MKGSGHDRSAGAQNDATGILQFCGRAAIAGRAFSRATKLFRPNLASAHVRTLASQLPGEDPEIEPGGGIELYQQCDWKSWMSSIVNTRTRSEECQSPASPPDVRVQSIPVLGPLFLMTNSLETGGTERQFVELARSLRADQLHVHLCCIQKKGAFLEGLGELHQFGLGGSLYGLQSIQSRWKLRRCLQDLGIAVAHAFDFYSNLTLIPAATLARLPVVIGSHRQLGDLLTPAQFRAQLMMFRWCDRVVCNSRAAADRLLQAGLPERKVVVIGNAF